MREEMNKYSPGLKVQFAMPTAINGEKQWPRPPEATPWTKGETLAVIIPTLCVWGIIHFYGQVIPWSVVMEYSEYWGPAALMCVLITVVLARRGFWPFGNAWFETWSEAVDDGFGDLDAMDYLHKRGKPLRERASTHASGLSTMHVVLFFLAVAFTAATSIIGMLTWLGWTRWLSGFVMTKQIVSNFMEWYALPQQQGTWVEAGKSLESSERAFLAKIPSLDSNTGVDPIVFEKFVHDSEEAYGKASVAFAERLMAKSSVTLVKAPGADKKKEGEEEANKPKGKAGGE
jgi:hypothetical protein